MNKSRSRVTIKDIITIIQTQNDVGVNQDGRSGGNEKGLNFTYILSIVLIGVLDGLVSNVNRRE